MRCKNTFDVIYLTQLFIHFLVFLQVGDARMMVISSSPSEDHSYTSMDGDGGEEEYLPAPQTPQATPVSSSAASLNQPPPAKKANHSPTSSVDEAFSDDSYESDVAR